jgi:hypothetical protein
MDLDRDNRRRRPLVTVGSHTETDIATGETERQLFVKMYFEARDSGLLAAIPDRLWKMLCVLATYIDQNGNCYPSQQRIAEDLGTTRETVNRTVKELLAFRFQGRPVIGVSKVRLQTSSGSRWANNVYRLHPISGFQIFDRTPKRASEPEKPPSNQANEAYVMESSHRPVLENRHTGPGEKRHTNQNQVTNQTHTEGVDFSGPGRGRPPGLEDELVTFFHEQAGHPKARRPTERELGQAKALLAEHGVEAARHIVRFALQKAEETRFQMRHFGAVLSYAAEAVTEFADRREREAKAARIREREERERAEEEEAWQRLSPWERVEKRLETRVALFRIRNRNRSPRPEELEELRRECAEREGVDLDGSNASAARA